MYVCVCCPPLIAKRANRGFIKFNNIVLLNSILSDEKTSKFIKTNRDLD